MTTETTETRPCTKCGAVLPLTSDYFHKDNTKKTGFRAGCKSCMNETKFKAAVTRRVRNKPGPRRTYEPPGPVALPAPAPGFDPDFEAKKRALLELVDIHHAEFDNILHLMRTRIASEARQAS